MDDETLCDAHWPQSAEEKVEEFGRRLAALRLELAPRLESAARLGRDLAALERGLAAMRAALAAVSAANDAHCAGDEEAVVAAIRAVDDAFRSASAALGADDERGRSGERARGRSLQ